MSAQIDILLLDFPCSHHLVHFVDRLLFSNWLPRGRCASDTCACPRRCGRPAGVRDFLPREQDRTAHRLRQPYRPRKLQRMGSFCCPPPSGEGDVDKLDATAEGSGSEPEEEPDSGRTRYPSLAPFNMYPPGTVTIGDPPWAVLRLRRPTTWPPQIGNPAYRFWQAALPVTL